jgi:ribosomal protein S18 acetylase RimI-like enzyme
VEAEIREARLSDQAGLNALWGEADALHHAALPHVFAPPTDPVRSEEAVAAILTDTDQAVFVAQIGLHLVGVVHVGLRERRPPMRTKRFAVVEAIAVTASHRGSGIGRRLMAAAERWAQDRGAAEVWLDVWTFNERAIAFYEDLGYETVSQRMRKDMPI